MNNSIEVVDLQKTVRVGFWGTRKDLLRGVSFNVPQGVIFGFVGPNGAGKSTTIKTLIGAARPTRGEARVLGRTAQDIDVRRRIGYLPELPQLPLTLTPDELLFLHGTLAGLDKTTLNKRRDALLDRVGLSERRRDRVATFSKGMQQRVGLALALLNEPDLVILDEPMSGLDPLGRRLVRELISEQKARGATVFFSSHVLPDVEALCDELAIIHRGLLVTSGSVKGVLASAATAVDVTVRANETVVGALSAHYAVSARGEFAVVKLPGDTDLVENLSRMAALGASVVAVETIRPHLEDQLVALLESSGHKASSPTDIA
jgi:ABC-2 type transport system ATP-binding protein